MATLCAVTWSCHAPPRYVFDASVDAAPVDRAVDLPPDAAACGCAVDDQDTLNLSWDCYCTRPYVGCGVPLSSMTVTDCETRERTDYPDCGLTVIVESTGPSAGLPSVYDAQGKLAGRLSRTEAAPYACPSDPSVFGSMERAGRFPSPSCRAVSCGGCYAEGFPCPAGPD